MKTTAVLILLLCFALQSCSGPSSPITLPSVPNAQWENHTDDVIEAYSIGIPSEGEGVLMISKWPTPSFGQSEAAFTRNIIQGVIQGMAENEGTIFSNEVVTEPITNGAISYVTFTAPEGEYVQLSLAMMANGSLWNGQFTGPLAALDQVKGLIEDLR